MAAEHHRADLGGANATHLVQRACQRLARGTAAAGCADSHAPRIDEHGVAAGRLDDRHAHAVEAFDDVLVRAHPVAQVVLVDAPRAAPARSPPGRARRVRRRSGTPRSGSAGCGHAARGRRRSSASQPPMLTSASFFADIVMPSAVENMSRTMSVSDAARLSGLALLDEVGVLGKPTGVDEERIAVRRAMAAAPWMFSRLDRLPATGVVRHREHRRHAHVVGLARHAPIEPLEIDVSLERVRSCGIRPSGIGRSSASAPANSMLPRVVSKCVFDGTTGPGRPRIENRIASAARP